VFRPILDPGTSKLQVRGIIVSDSLFGCFLANPCVYEEWASRDDVYEADGRPEGGALYFGRMLGTKLS